MSSLGQPLFLILTMEGAEIQQKHKYSQGSNSKMFKGGWGNFLLILLFPIEETEDGGRAGVLSF